MFVLLSRTLDRTQAGRTNPDRDSGYTSTAQSANFLPLAQKTSYVTYNQVATATLASRKTVKYRTN